MLEITIDSFIPISFTPFLLLIWSVVNVLAVIFLFELTAGFYCIGYTFPAYALWIILIEVWSGYGNYLRTGLPILIAWWVTGHFTAYLGIRERCLNRSARQTAAEDKER